jgi:hypothetical protein
LEGVRLTGRKTKDRETIHPGLLDIDVVFPRVCVIRRVGYDRVVQVDALAKADS